MKTMAFVGSLVVIAVASAFVAGVYFLAKDFAE